VDIDWEWMRNRHQHMTTTTEHKPQRPKRPKRRFDEEFRRDAIALVKSTGKPLGEIAAQLGITHWNLRDWMKRERREGQAGAASTQEMQRVIARLQRENESLQAQCDVLKKAMGILSTPSRNASHS
jgi:transposase